MRRRGRVWHIFESLPPSQKAEPSVSGTVVRQHLDALTEAHGAAAVSAALATLSASEREHLTSALATDWVPLSTLEAFYEAAAPQVGKRVADLQREMGARGVEQRLKTVWRVLLRFTSDEALVARTPIFYAKTYDTGRLSSRVVSPGRGEIELTDWPGAPDFVRRGLSVGIATVLRLAGRKNVGVADEKRKDGALFVATWEP
jgi:hypothetical protein